ncbi:4'-phosphopantetheinyl transferase family protein [Xanthomonas arboricola]|uniref:4'-phosphopantetheinyl transferase family protein n=1 Tax=Xanthomonas arboricola TaxID=56448 RepID=UPI001379C500|nr:4'-phosphopantetheinyl transferase superfamily protein [Xanthomonas arboricola]
MSWHAVGFEGEMPFAAFAHRLPPNMRQVSRKRINEYLAGRYCAERALEAAGAEAGCWLPRGSDHLPIWPPGWIGSISHADGIAAAAVVARVPGTAVGLDVERWINADQAAQICRLIASPAELELLVALPPEQALTLLFSAKEALFKALYPSARRFMEFSAARLVDANNKELSLQLSEHWSLDWAQGTIVPVRFLLQEAYVSAAALAHRTPGAG